MTEISAFIGHSFDKQDGEVVSAFLNFFDRVAGMGIGFSWDHAEEAQPKLLSQKVRGKFEGKNLFVGICTSKERVISPGQLRRPLIQRNSFCANAEHFLSKTSDWILQEVGCAFGRDMEIILLQEHGLRNPGDILGDFEYIEFLRDRPERSFTKILEMIQALLPAEPAPTISPLEKPAVGDDEEGKQAEEEGVAVEIREDWEGSDYARALFMAIATGDKEREAKIFDAFLETEFAAGDHGKVNWIARRKYLRTSLQKEDHLNELLELSANNPESNLIPLFLGYLYQNFDQEDVAASYFQKSAELTDKPDERVSRLILASHALASSGSVSEAVSILEEVKAYDETIPDLESRLLAALSKIYVKESEVDLNLALTESYLNLHPNEHDKRFSLAYKYAHLGEHVLALYHYLLIGKERPREGVWNNVGVAYSHLGLPAKSVEAYAASRELGGTLAMSNLADKLIRAGFLDDADELCQEALKIENYDKAIGDSLSNIKGAREKEADKLESLLEALKPRRDFYMRFGHACLLNHLAESQGTLECPQFILNYKIEGNVFRGDATYKEEKKSLLTIPQLVGKLAGTATDFETYHTRFEGKIFGTAIAYSQWTYKEGEPVKDEPDVKGLMIATPDLGEIDVYEIGSREQERFYRFIRAVESVS